VAGLEPENTNLFLQMLGTAARMGTAADAVQVSNPSFASRNKANMQYFFMLLQHASISDRAHRLAISSDMLYTSVVMPFQYKHSLSQEEVGATDTLLLLPQRVLAGGGQPGSTSQRSREASTAGQQRQLAQQSSEDR
jgi:hypothetical protein